MPYIAHAVYRFYEKFLFYLEPVQKMLYIIHAAQFAEDFIQKHPP